VQDIQTAGPQDKTIAFNLNNGIVLKNRDIRSAKAGRLDHI